MPVRFCGQCNNMLYPKENTQKRRAGEGRELVYACRNCDHKESVEVPRDPVYRNVLVHSAAEKMAMTYEVTADPTLPRTYSAQCSNCNCTEAVYYQSPVGKNDEALVLVFVCVGCGKTWLSSNED